MLDSEIPVRPGAPCSPLYLQMLIKDGSSGPMTSPIERLQSISSCLPPHTPPPPLTLHSRAVWWKLLPGLIYMPLGANRRLPLDSVFTAN